MLNFQDCTNSLRVQDEITINLTSANIEDVIEEIKKYNRLYLKNLKIEVGDSEDSLQELINVCALKKIGQIEFTREIKQISPAAILIKNGESANQELLDNNCILQMQQFQEVQPKALEKKEDSVIDVLDIKTQYQPRVAKSKQLSRSRQKSKSRSSSKGLTELHNTFRWFISRHKARFPMLSHRYYKAYKDKINNQTFYTTSALNQLLRYNLLDEFDLYHPPAGFFVKFNDQLDVWVIDYDSQVKNRSDYQIKINPEYNRPYLNNDQVGLLINKLPNNSNIKTSYNQYNRDKKLLLRKYLPEIISLPNSAILYLEQHVLNKEPVNELVLQYYLDEKNHVKTPSYELMFNNKLNYILLTPEDQKKHEVCEALTNIVELAPNMSIAMTSSRLDSKSVDALALYNSFKPKCQQYYKKLEDTKLEDPTSLEKIKKKIKLNYLKSIKNALVSVGEKNWPYYFTLIGLFLDIDNHESYKDAYLDNQKMTNLAQEVDRQLTSLGSVNDTSVNDDIDNLRPNLNINFNDFVTSLENKSEVERYAIDILLEDIKGEQHNDLKSLNNIINEFDRKKLYKKHFLRLYLSKSNQFLQEFYKETNPLLIKALLQSDIDHSQYMSCKDQINSWSDSSKKVFYKLIEKHLDHHDETNLPEMVRFFNKFKTKYSFIDSFDIMGTDNLERQPTPLGSDRKEGQTSLALDNKEEQISLALDNVESLPCALSEMSYFLQKVPENQRKAQLNELLTNKDWNFSANNNHRYSVLVQQFHHRFQEHHFYRQSFEGKFNSLLAQISQSKKERLIDLTTIKSILTECKDDLEKLYIKNLARSIMAEDTKSYEENGIYNEESYKQDVKALKEILQNPHGKLPMFAKLAIKAIGKVEDDFNQEVNNTLFNGGASQNLAVYDLRVYVERLLKSGENVYSYLRELH